MFGPDRITVTEWVMGVCKVCGKRHLLFRTRLGKGYHYGVFTEGVTPGWEAEFARFDKGFRECNFTPPVVDIHELC